MEHWAQNHKVSSWIFRLGCAMYFWARPYISCCSSSPSYRISCIDLCFSLGEGRLVCMGNYWSFINNLARTRALEGNFLRAISWSVITEEGFYLNDHYIELACPVLSRKAANCSILYIKVQNQVFSLIILLSPIFL